MNTCEMNQRGEVAGFENSPSSSTNWSSITRLTELRALPFGRIPCVTLTERVVAFLERYKPVYGLQ